MADNYLEKKMEEHRNGKHMPSRRLTPKGTQPGMVTLPFPHQKAVIDSHGQDPDSVASAFAKALRSTGCRVALRCPASKTATAFAQQNNLLLVPDNAALPADFGTIDITASIGPDGSLRVDTQGRTFSVKRSDSDSMVAMALFLCLPQANVLGLEGDFPTL